MKIYLFVEFFILFIYFAIIFRVSILWFIDSPFVFIHIDNNARSIIVMYRQFVKCNV